MNSAVDSDAVVAPDRLRLVTQNFRELQGLRWVLFGVTFAIFNLSLPWSAQRPWVLIPIILPMGIIAKYLDRYYERRFGRIETSPEPEMWRLVRALMAGLPVAGVIVGATLTRHIVHPDPKRIALSFLLMWVSIFCYVFSSRLQLLSLRKRYLVPTFVAGTIVALYPILCSMDSAMFSLWKELIAGLIPLSMIIVGLCDHVVLLRLMPKPASEDDNDEQI